jgi:hypothetical protein
LVFLKIPVNQYQMRAELPFGVLPGKYNAVKYGCRRIIVNPRVSLLVAQS